MAKYYESNHGFIPSQFEKYLRNAYISSVEPREKRIAELEQKLEQTEKDLADYQFNYPTIKELEKENAELKNRNQELLESCEGATMMYKDLQKAKGVIKKYLSIGVGGKITQNYLDVTKEAEQFIKDLEK